MQSYRHNKFVLKLMLSLLLLMTVSAYAGNGNNQPFARHVLQLASDGNPWALPPQPADFMPGFAPLPHQLNGQWDTQRQIPRQFRGDRFVTPEIIESIKQQQKQAQKTPDYRRNQSYRTPRSNVPQNFMPAMPMQPSFTYPPSRMMPDAVLPGMLNMPRMPGLQTMNPLHDAPAVSPWGSGYDVLNRGASSPWVPNAAIGGIPPMHIQPFDDFTENNESGYGWHQNLNQNQNQKLNQNSVFNPFTFGPGSNL